MYAFSELFYDGVLTSMIMWHVHRSLSIVHYMLHCDREYFLGEYQSSAKHVNNLFFKFSFELFSV